MVSSSGFGRLSTAFNPSGYFLILPLRLRWRLPKIIFIINRYVITMLLLYVFGELLAFTHVIVT